MLFSMLPAIDFNHQAFLQADEINDESTERLLSTKFVPAQLPRPKLAPQKPFGVCHVLSELPGFVHIHLEWNQIADSVLRLSDLSLLPLETVSQLSFRGEAEKSVLCMWLKMQDPSLRSG